MKILITTLLSLLVITSTAQAKIIGNKDWSFFKVDEDISWNSISENYDEDGKRVCKTDSCVPQFWASISDIEELLSLVNLDDLTSLDSFGLTLFLGSRTSFCSDSTCVWEGWLRDENPLNTDQAASAFFQGTCFEPEVECSGFSGFHEFSYDKTQTDEARFGGISIDGYFAYTTVNTPNVVSIILLLFGLLFVEKYTCK